MPHLAALLTAVATLIVGRPVPVACHAPARAPWTGNVYGFTLYTRPPRVYLRACRATRALRPWAVTVFAHELIHVEHPGWAHPKVYRLAGWYGRKVVRPKIRAARGA